MTLCDSLLCRLRPGSLGLGLLFHAHVVQPDRSLALLTLLKCTHRRLRLHYFNVLLHDGHAQLPDVRLVDLGQLVHVAEYLGAFHQRRVLARL